MGIGTSKGAFHEDEFRMEASPWFIDPKELDDNVANPDVPNPGEFSDNTQRFTRDQNVLTPGQIFRNKQLEDVELSPATGMGIEVGMKNSVIRASQIEKGNIDLNNRPRVMNKDGSISTVRSITVGVDDGKTAVIPTVHDDGYIMNNEDAIKHFQDTGKHLGIFDDLDEANGYAQQLHLDQANQYLNK